MMKPITAAFAALAIILLLGIAGTPDYVLEVERENDALRAQLQKSRASTLACQDIQQSSQIARAE